MKALEILKEIRGEADFNEDFKLMQDCDEVIKEIEELQSTIESQAITLNEYADSIYSKSKFIESQDIIIKDKSAIVEAMENEKSCHGCTHHPLNSNDCYELHCEYCKRNSDDIIDNFELHIAKAQP